MGLYEMGVGLQESPRKNGIVGNSSVDDFTSTLSCVKLKIKRAACCEHGGSGP